MLFDISCCFCMFVNKHFIYLGVPNSKSKCCFNAKLSAYCFYVKTKLTIDFQICISVPLSKKPCSVLSLARSIIYKIVYVIIHFVIIIVSYLALIRVLFVGLGFRQTKRKYIQYNTTQYNVLTTSILRIHNSVPTASTLDSKFTSQHMIDVLMATVIQRCNRKRQIHNAFSTSVLRRCTSVCEAL